MEKGEIVRTAEPKTLFQILSVNFLSLLVPLNRIAQKWPCITTSSSAEHTISWFSHLSQTSDRANPGGSRQSAARARTILSPNQTFYGISPKAVSRAGPLGHVYLAKHF